MSRAVRAVAALGLMIAMTAGPAAGLDSGSGYREPLWVARYDEGLGPDLARSIAVGPDGRRVFVAGESADGPSFDFATVAYSARTGRMLWKARYDGPQGGNDWGYALAVAPDGKRVFVTGPSEQSPDLFAPADYATVAYDARTGLMLWSARYDGPAGGEDTALATAVSPDGDSVFVTGASEGSGTDTDVATVAYDSATGAERWVARYDGPAGEFSYDAGRAAAVSPDGALVHVAGFSKGARTEEDYVTISYRADDGDEAWLARYDGPGHHYDVAYAMAVGGNGNVYVTGSSKGAGFGLPQDYGTVAYAGSTGAELWEARYTITKQGQDLAFAVAVTPGGDRVYVTGQAQAGFGNDDYATVAYRSASGVQRWAATYSGPPIQEAAYGIGVSPDGKRVFVTGGSDAAGTGEDYVTIGYHAFTGAEAWVAIYDGDEDIDRAAALAVSPDGTRVFVTGFSVRGRTGYDYATVAYAG